MFVTVFTNMKVHMNFKEFLYFSLFSSVTSAALNTIQISYGDSSDIFTYDIARQSVVREKSGKTQGIFVRIFGGNPALPLI